MTDSETPDLEEWYRKLMDGSATPEDLAAMDDYHSENPYFFADGHYYCKCTMPKPHLGLLDVHMGRIVDDLFEKSSPIRGGQDETARIRKPNTRREIMITRYYGLAVPKKLALEIEDCAGCEPHDPNEPLGMPTFCEEHLKALDALRAADREARMQGREIRLKARAEDAERFLEDSTGHLESVIEMTRKLGGDMVHYSDGFVEIRDIPLLDGLRVVWTYDVYRMLNAAIQGHGHYQQLCDEIALRVAAEDDGEVIEDGR